MNCRWSLNHAGGLELFAFHHHLASPLCSNSGHNWSENSALISSFRIRPWVRAPERRGSVNSSRARVVSARSRLLGFQESYDIASEAPVGEGTAVRTIVVEDKAGVRYTVRGFSE
jgi:hypothetical protein